MRLKVSASACKPGMWSHRLESNDLKMKQQATMKNTYYKLNISVTHTLNCTHTCTDNLPTLELTLWIIGPKEEQLVSAVLTAGSPGPERESSHTTVSLTGCKVTARALEPTEQTGRWQLCCSRRARQAHAYPLDRACINTQVNRQGGHTGCTNDNPFLVLK